MPDAGASRKRQITGRRISGDINNVIRPEAFRISCVTPKQDAWAADL
jgi:hypothetical protein